jgi:2-polyprenyl-6-hydroxyphenyl methylase/3-demethylubiquinone-9 3-methyltransferase
MAVDNQMYDRLAHTWWSEGGTLSALNNLIPGRFAYLDEVLAARGHAYPGLEVLDLGCGGGLMSEAYARRGARVTGVDPSAESLAVARSHARQSGLSIRYEPGTGESIPLPDGSFDLVSCCDVLEHVNDLDTVSREVARLLRPGGFYFFDTINRTWLSWVMMIKFAEDWARAIPSRTHDWNMFITPEELRASLECAGLAVRDLTGLSFTPNPLRLGSALLRTVLGSGDRDTALAFMGPSPITSVIYMGWAEPSLS